MVDLIEPRYSLYDVVVRKYSLLPSRLGSWSVTFTCLVIETHFNSSIWWLGNTFTF